jgi:hypothetical protein
MAALLVLAGEAWHGWHLGLLVWGLAVTAALVVWAIANEKLALRLAPDAPDERKARLRSRQRVLEINFAAFGVGVAVLASGTGWTAVDAVFTGFFVIGGGLSTLAGVMAVRR